MGFWCITRSLLAFRGRVGVYARKHTGHSLYVSSIPGVSALTGVQAKRYSQLAEDRVQGPLMCYHLHHRTLLKILGEDTSPFLQGIITNDIELLQEPGRRAIYSHMLNVQGRTLYDIMLYSFEEADAGCGVLLECDSATLDSVLRHLKMYKLRRKINVTPCPDISVWAVLPLQKQQCQQLSKPELSLPERSLVWETDPRTPKMGWRLVLDSQIEPANVIASCQKGDTNDYHRHRYTIGLPEGVNDLPPGVALPLESNIVYMQGISFSKGCYIGQELTARTHHTGVVRKRLMPVRLSRPIEHIKEGATLHTQSGKPAGKHRAGIDKLGLSLIRMAHAKEALILKSSDDTTVTLEVSVPNWWPKDMKTN